MGDAEKLQQMLEDAGLDCAKRIAQLRRDFAGDLRVIRRNVVRLGKQPTTEHNIVAEEALLNFIDEQIDGYDKRT